MNRVLVLMYAVDNTVFTQRFVSSPSVVVCVEMLVINKSECTLSLIFTVGCIYSRKCIDSFYQFT